MWIAEMESEHYTWRAAGDSEADALAALAAGWDQRMARAIKDTGDGWRPTIAADAFEYYGASTWEAIAGTATLDGSTLVEGVAAHG